MRAKLLLTFSLIFFTNFDVYAQEKASTKENNSVFGRINSNIVTQDNNGQTSLSKIINSAQNDNVSASRKNTIVNPNSIAAKIPHAVWGYILLSIIVCGTLCLIVFLL